jgi:hypothetical protein
MGGYGYLRFGSAFNPQAKAVAARGRGARKRARNGAVGVYGLERPSNVSFATVEYLNEWIRIWI